MSANPQEETLYGMPQSLHVLRSGDSLIVRIPDCRVPDESSGVIGVCLSNGQPYATASAHGGWLGVWKSDQTLFIVHKQPGHSQSVGTMIDAQTGKWKSIKSAAALVEEDSVPAEVAALVD